MATPVVPPPRSGQGIHESLDGPNTTPQTRLSAKNPIHCPSGERRCGRQSLHVALSLIMKIQKWIRMGMLMVATAESAAFEDLESEEAAHQSFEHISA